MTGIFDIICENCSCKNHHFEDMYVVCNECGNILSDDDVQALLHAVYAIEMENEE